MSSLVWEVVMLYRVILRVNKPDLWSSVSLLVQAENKESAIKAARKRVGEEFKGARALVETIRRESQTCPENAL